MASLKEPGGKCHPAPRSPAAGAGFNQLQMTDSKMAVCAFTNTWTKNGLSEISGTKSRAVKKPVNFYFNVLPQNRINRCCAGTRIGLWLTAGVLSAVRWRPPLVMMRNDSYCTTANIRLQIKISKKCSYRFL